MSPCHRFATLIHSIQEVLARDWFVRLLHLHREGNRSANWLAKKGREGLLKWPLWERAPPELAMVVAKVTTRTVFHRGQP